MHWIFFAVKRNIVSEISKEILDDIFAEFDGSSVIKNITDTSLNIGGLQIDNISPKFTSESTKKYIAIR